MGKKAFVLDTSGVVHAPTRIFTSFNGHDVIVPITVLRELDELKIDSSRTVAYSAREALRQLDELQKFGNLREGINLPNGGILRVELNCTDLSRHGLPMTKNDNRILGTAVYLKSGQQNGGNGKKKNKSPRTIYERVEIVSKDRALRLLADALGIIAEDYKADKVDVNMLYSGIKTVKLTAKDLSMYHASGKIDLAGGDFYPHQFVAMTEEGREDKSVYGIYDPKQKVVRKLVYPDSFHINAMNAKNDEQLLALNLLMDPNIPLVTMVGPAGTGKTILALLASLFQVLGNSDLKIDFGSDKEEDENKKGKRVKKSITDLIKTTYRRLLLARPIVAVGGTDKLGFLPGGLDDKLYNWNLPFFDNLQEIFGAWKFNHVKGTRDGKQYNNIVELLQATGQLEIASLIHARGRTLPEQFIIIDDAQNLTLQEVLMIVTRVGHGSKIVFTGDIEQIDNPYLTPDSNGLSILIEQFKDDDLAGHVTLIQSQRSKLAERAAQKLNPYNLKK